ncbi:hypothetical protein PVAND_011767 [Polypedilum vanderplanki]|uniref:RRM domain-containing protein n=1 Tax=Polypedilum vanderplanki TaxID=319348 RepID=A0A9J6CLE6_POLVA|nr:hypothetical protein PVAND_011767 [Polypedilum vanderplanki]
MDFEILNHIDDLNIITGRLKLLIQKLCSKNDELESKQKIYDQLYAENQRLSTKLAATKAKSNIIKRKNEHLDGFDSMTSCSSIEGTYQYKLSGLMPLIEREEIKKYFSRFGEVVHVNLIPDGIKRWDLQVADAIIFYNNKPKDSIFAIRHFLRGKEIELTPKPPALHIDKTKVASIAPITRKPKLERTYSTVSTIMAINDTKSRSVMVIEEHPPFLTNLNLETFFAIYGKVIKITPFKPNKKTVPSYTRIFFVKFENYEAAEASIGNHRIGVKIIRVKPAKDR